MGHTNKKDAQPKLSTKERLRQRKKESKKLLTAKRARLIVKNLPFAATEENLKEHFEKFGEVAEVTLLKKPDGKLVGCGFIQFNLVQKAAKARHHTNGKDFLGRIIDCDFALSKDIYKQKVKREEAATVEVKEEPLDSDVVDLSAVKEEVDEEIEAEEVKDEQDIDKSEDSEDSESEVEDEKESRSESEDEPEEESEDEDNENEDSEIELNKTETEEEKKPRVVSNDVQEGKTVFVKNIPFSVTNEEFKECMKQFGPVYYALICFDKLTEHSKGTGFVKFVNIEDAEKCLQAGTELKLADNILDCHRAMSKADLSKKGSENAKDKHKDSRNLYLIKEGVILAGTKAAQGVSASDMAKRLQLEQYKTQILRNLNMFISRYRLIVHNVPSSWDDKKLKTLFQKHAGSKAVIREAKIMRNFRNIDEKGVGKSKEYGFVSFTMHEDAIRALRALNNNPKIFSANKRPIVAFSIENKVMVKAKEKRLTLSKQNNPISREFVPKKKEDGKPQRNARKRKFDAIDHSNSGNAQTFSGISAKPGLNKMRNRYKLKTQAQIHHESLKKEKQKKKSAKKPLKERRKEFTKQDKQKIKRKSEKDNFSKLVSDYKKKLYDANLNANKSKWYE